MISRYLLLVLSVFVFVGVSGFAHAAEEPVEEVGADDEKVMSVYQKIQEFTKDFDEASEQHFYALYGSYNMIKVVEDVQDQVGDAIDKCSEANPDMKEALDTRYREWRDALSGVMDDANANVDNMIIAQEYAKPRKIRSLMKFMDKTRVQKNQDVEKFPVTSPEACEYLRAKMDETQESLASLLESTLISYPQSLIQQGQPEDDHDHDHDENGAHVHEGDEHE